MLRLIDLNIGYTNSLLKQNFSFSTCSPSLIALIGDNGTGKTTLLKTIARIKRPLNGQVLTLKKNIHQLSPHQSARLVSIVLSSFPFHLNLTITEILKLTRSSVHGQIDNALIDQIAYELGITDILNKQFSALSDGQKQKTMIARALIQDTPILLLDEPFSHLDYKNKTLLINQLNKLKHKKLIIFSTHDELSIINADIVWHLDNRKINILSTHNFLINSNTLKDFYNFYNIQIVNNGKKV